MIIELIRHGETALQAESRYQGSTDAPLSEKGMRALISAGTRPDLLCVTSLIRTQQTAAILFPNVPQMIVPGLEEMNFGVFEGRNYREMEHDAQYRHWVDGMCEGRCPDGESRAEFCSRADAAFQKLVLDAADKEVGMLTLVVHGGTIMSVLEAFCTDGRNYFEWHTESGKGFLLSCRNPETGPILELLGTTDHTAGR